MGDGRARARAGMDAVECGWTELELNWNFSQSRLEVDEKTSRCGWVGWLT